MEPIRQRPTARLRASLEAVLKLSLLALLLAGSVGAAEVYRWRDAAGVVHYGDRPPARADAERLSLPDQPDPPASPAPAAAAAPTPVGTPQAAPPPARKPIDILMYSNPQCGFCIRAEKLFRARGVPWRVADITASSAARDEFKRLGGTGTPLIFIDGERIGGFNQARLERILDSYGW
jgi:glutaredoxin